MTWKIILAGSKKTSLTSKVSIYQVILKALTTKMMKSMNMEQKSLRMKKVKDFLVMLAQILLLRI